MSSEPTISGTVKPLMRGVSHQVAFFAAVIAGGSLVWAAPSFRAKVACGIYAASLCALLGVSALYHRVTWSTAARARMRRLDHSAIFVLIAGTYTPLAITLPPLPAHLMLGVGWVGAILGIFKSLVWVKAPKWLPALLALALGWVAVFHLPELRQVLGNGPVIWLGIGGGFYSTGAVIYTVKKPNPWPEVFGYHEIFHALVIAAAICHFIAICQALPAMAS